MLKDPFDFDFTDTNPVKTEKEEQDALAAEFMDYVPTCICAGCETHPEGCTKVCRDNTQPGVLGLAALVREPADNPREFWEEVTEVSAPAFLKDDDPYSFAYDDIGGEGG